MRLFKSLSKAVVAVLATLSFSACEVYDTTNYSYEIENKSSQIIYLNGKLYYNNGAYTSEYMDELKPGYSTYYFYDKSKSEIDLTANKPTFMDKDFSITNYNGKVYNKDFLDVKNWYIKMLRTEKNYASHEYTLIITDDDFK